ncbi:MAG: 2Fe-2S iron-sulfur cluster-binding protein [Microthrixaceae bacterium]
MVEPTRGTGLDAPRSVTLGEGSSADPVSLEVNGRAVSVKGTSSLAEALLAFGPAVRGGVSCMGQGVCGACRAMVRRAGGEEVTMELGCTVLVEEGMHVTFLEDLGPQRLRPYELGRQNDTWLNASRVLEAFPEALDCRHCSGCVEACPVGIEVEGAVASAVEGKLSAAAAAFDECVMCDLCTMTCPDFIAPNHLGLFVRRLLANGGLRPGDLLLRLHQIRSGAMTVDAHAPVPGDPGAT